MNTAQVCFSICRSRDVAKSIMLEACISSYLSFMPISDSIFWIYCCYGFFNMSTIEVALNLVRVKREKNHI